ncbi:hypothetical protein [Kordia sp.]|uniref:hypothetical protein n=1 Tax=Kordia sp. TaxID=1965332 RepID=UPI003D2A3AED
MIPSLFYKQLKHLLKSNSRYLNKSSIIRLAMIDNIVRNKDYYLEISEYFNLFLKGEIEKGVDNKIENLAEDIERKLYIKYLEDTKDYLTLSDKLEALARELNKLKNEVSGGKANNTTS